MQTHIITHIIGLTERTTANCNNKNEAKLVVKLKINEIMKRDWQLKPWKVSINTDDTQITLHPFLKLVGIPNTSQSRSQITIPLPDLLGKC